MTEPHIEGEHWVAQEGPFSAATSDVAVLHYFPARGRAEPIRLVLSLVRQPWFEPPVEPLAAVMRRQLDSFPFRQLPRYLEEGNVDLVQSMAILRHIGRKHKLYGGDLQEAATVDMLLEAVADLRAKLKEVWCGAGLSPHAVADYIAVVLAPEQQLTQSDAPVSLRGSSRSVMGHLMRISRGISKVKGAAFKGPGLACLERMLVGARRQWPASCDEPGLQGDAARHVSGDNSSWYDADDAACGDAADVLRLGSARRGAEDEGSREAGVGFNDEEEDEGRLWLVGNKTTIADIAVADLVDMHLEASQLEGHVRATFPQLVLLRRRVMGLPGIKAYLGSKNRHSLIWGQDWQPDSNNKDANKMLA